jgi:hypothetical protein
VDQRFTIGFVQRLIEEQDKLEIEGSGAGDSEESFDRDMLEGDIRGYREMVQKAEGVFAQIEDDEGMMGGEEGAAMREEFNNIKAQIAAQPMYDKELTVKIQTLEWLYSASDMLQSKEGEPLSVGTWDAKLKQGENYLSAVPQA